MNKVQQLLKDQLETLKAKSKATRGDEVISIMEKHIEVAKHEEIQGLPIGAEAPNFTVVTALGEIIELNKLLKQGPVVLVFYRGAWCPYCNLELKAYNEMMNTYRQIGIRVIAIPPQKPEESIAMVQKGDLKFDVVSDPNLEIASQYNIVHQVYKELQELYLSFGFDLPNVNGDDSWRLPLPATFVIAPTRKIMKTFVEADYRERLEPQEALEAAKLSLSAR